MTYDHDRSAVTRRLAIGVEPGPDTMRRYRWLSELPYGLVGDRIVQRLSDECCARVQHDPETDRVRAVLGEGPAADATFDLIVHRWVGPELGRWMASRESQWPS